MLTISQSYHHQCRWTARTNFSYLKIEQVASEGAARTGLRAFSPYSPLSLASGKSRLWRIGCWKDQEYVADVRFPISTLHCFSLPGKNWTLDGVSGLFLFTYIALLAKVKNVKTQIFGKYTWLNDYTQKSWIFSFAKPGLSFGHFYGNLGVVDLPEF